LADTVEPTATSITSTLFLGRKLWKNATLYFNPEISGGKGLSFASGVAGALNGETYRVGTTTPSIFIARAYLKQNFALDDSYTENVSDDLNQISERIPSNRLVISVGKFAISDFFDDNTFSKDPRTQFFNWSLWANGAWDYPANTRGYTIGTVVEIIKPNWEVRLSSVAVPRMANQSLLEYNSKAHSETFEIAHKYSYNNHVGNIRLLISDTHSQSPSYNAAIMDMLMGIGNLAEAIQGNRESKIYGGTKTAIGLNIDQEITNNVGIFSRIGWNDGKYATWAFTEIDQTMNVGVNIKGAGWKRPNDVLGIATVVNGISNEHQAYLKAGGYGCIIGDGNLNYGNEGILETFYNARVTKFFNLSIDYQFVNYPGYNKDRGPVHVLGIRCHTEI